MWSGLFLPEVFSRASTRGDGKADELLTANSQLADGNQR
jgi:hypothetical protein